MRTKQAVVFGGTLLLALAFAAPAAAGMVQQGQESPRLENLPSRQIAEERAAANELLQVQKPADRLVLVEEFLRRYPDSPFLGRVYLAAAEAYRMLGNYEKAIENGEKVLERNPQDLIARILLADSLVEGTVPSAADSAERYQRAEELARQVLEQLPVVYADAKRPPALPPEEFDLQRRLIESQPRATLGYIHLIQGDNQKAEEELKRSVELNQVNPNGADYLRLAVAHIRQEEWAEAKVVLERCTQLGGQAAVLAHEYLAVVAKKIAGQEAPEKELPQE